MRWTSVPSLKMLPHRSSSPAPDSGHRDVGISGWSGNASVVAPCVKTEAQNAKAAWIFAQVGAHSRRAVNRGINKSEMKAIRGRSDWRFNLELKRKVGLRNRSRLGLVKGGYILQPVDSVRYLQTSSGIAASSIDYWTGSGSTELRQRHRRVASVSSENHRRRSRRPSERRCSDDQGNEVGQFHSFFRGWITTSSGQNAFVVNARE